MKLPELSELEAQLQHVMELGSMKDDTPGRRIAIKTMAAYAHAMGAEVTSNGITVSQIELACAKSCAQIILSSAKNATQDDPQKFGAAALALCVEIIERVRRGARPGNMEFVSTMAHDKIADFDFRKDLKGGEG